MRDFYLVAHPFYAHDVLGQHSQGFVQGNQPDMAYVLKGHHGGFYELPREGEGI